MTDSGSGSNRIERRDEPSEPSTPLLIRKLIYDGITVEEGETEDVPPRRVGVLAGTFQIEFEGGTPDDTYERTLMVIPSQYEDRSPEVITSALRSAATDQLLLLSLRPEWEDYDDMDELPAEYKLIHAQLFVLQFTPAWHQLLADPYAGRTLVDDGLVKPSSLPAVPGVRLGQIKQLVEKALAIG